MFPYQYTATNTPFACAGSQTLSLCSWAAGFTCLADFRSAGKAVWHAKVGARFGLAIEHGSHGGKCNECAMYRKHDPSMCVGPREGLKPETRDPASNNASNSMEVCNSIVEVSESVHIVWRSCFNSASCECGILWSLLEATWGKLWRWECLSYCVHAASLLIVWFVDLFHVMCSVGFARMWEFHGVTL